MDEEKPAKKEGEGTSEPPFSLFPFLFCRFSVAFREGGRKARGGCFSALRRDATEGSILNAFELSIVPFMMILLPLGSQDVPRSRPNRLRYRLQIRICPR